MFDLEEHVLRVGAALQTPDGTVYRAIDVGDAGTDWIRWEPFHQFSHWCDFYVPGTKIIDSGTGRIMQYPVSLPRDLIRDYGQNINSKVARHVIAKGHEQEQSGTVN